MVYDTSKNFLGDTYWKESNEPQEGDELTLDKGVMVEVADAVGFSQTDLTPLFEKKSPQAKPPATRPPPRPTAPPGIARGGTSQLKHKSLNALLGATKGPIGKALPVQSPYELRHEKENECTEGRPAKRQRIEHPTENALSSSPTKRGKAVTSKELPPPLRTPNIKKAPPATRSVPRGVSIISLDSEPDILSSEVTLPGTPPGILKSKSACPMPLVPAAIPKPVQLRDLSAQKTPKLPKGKVPLPHLKAKETPPPPPRSSSPPISASNRLSNIDFALQLELSPPKHPSPPLPPPGERKTKSLKLSTGPRRGVLLCQTLPQQQARAPNQNREPPSPKLKLRPNVKKASENTRLELVPLPFDEDEPLFRAQENSLIEEPASVVTRQRKVSPGAKESASSKIRNKEPSPPSSPDAFEDIELIHGLMDQQLIPKVPARHPASKAVAQSTPTVIDKVSERKEPVPLHITEAPNHTKTPSNLTRKVSNRVRKVRNVSPASPPDPPPSILDSSTTELSPPIRALAKAPSRTSTTSPRKPASSTGGSGKRPKRTQPRAQVPTSGNKIPTLPPHPLASKKNGVLMDASEISAQLSRPQKKQRIEDDPIEDSEQVVTGISPKKSFRRVRSENDAPILSTSEDWEKRNLPFETTCAASSKSNASNIDQKGKTKSGLASVIRRTDPRRKFQRTQSLNAGRREGAGRLGSLGGREDVEMVVPPVDIDMGPWSTEAFDLFDWRPPPKDGEAGIGMVVDK